MSGQGPASAHKVRRLSPTPQRQGPMKAVKPFILKPTSPSNVSPWQRPSPVESRQSPDRRSPSSPAFKVERPKAVRVSPASSSLRRTNSLDTIGTAYLKGQWPADIGGCHHTQSSGTFMNDKGTQTPEDWQLEVIERKTEKKKKKHRRSASFGHDDKKLDNLNSIRQKLQKTKDQGSKQRSSPVPANHNALLQTAPAVLMRSSVIHIPKTSIPRYQRNSVEGLSQELETMMSQLKTSGTEDDLERNIDDIPDGHRAPVPEIRHSGTRSIDTQTPSGTLDDRSSCSPASPASRPHSISPTIPIMAGHIENPSSRPSSNYDSSGSTPRDKSDKDTGDSDSDHCLKKTASPKPQFVEREPPDGCEIVKANDEDRRAPSIKEPLLFCPIQGHQFVLKPSSSSAFCSLNEMYTQGPLSQTLPSSIEGH